VSRAQALSMTTAPDHRPVPAAPADEPRPPHTLQESLERFGGAWLAAGVTTVVGAVAVTARVVVG
jgi:hypothetical protein